MVGSSSTAWTTARPLPLQHNVSVIFPTALFRP